MPKAYSQTLLKALQIIDKHGPIKPHRFGVMLWPDNENWQKYYKAGPKGSARGTGMNLVAGGYLARIARWGLAHKDYYWPQWAKTFVFRGYVLTAKGSELLHLAICAGLIEPEPVKLPKPGLE